MEAAASPASPTSSPSSSAAVASTAGGSSDSSAAAAAGGIPEHTPPRRRLVKASSMIAKREGAASGSGTGPPGFGLERSSGTSTTATIGTGLGQAGPPLGVPTSPASITNAFRERVGIRTIVKGDVQGDYPVVPPSGPAKLGRAFNTFAFCKMCRPPFAPNLGIMGDIRTLGRRPELNLQRRHESPSVQKHAPEDIRIQQGKRACIVRAQTMGATGNYKSFDSPFGNYMVPVIPNQLFNKTPTSAATPTSPSNVSPGVGR